MGDKAADTQVEVIDPPTYQEISKLAFAISLRPDAGSPLENWVRAEKELHEIKPSLGDFDAAIRSLQEAIFRLEESGAETGDLLQRAGILEARRFEKQWMDYDASKEVIAWYTTKLVQCGTFSVNIETREWTSEDHDENKWIQIFNRFAKAIEGKKEWNKDLNKLHLDTLLSLGDGDWIHHAGLPHSLGLTIQVANTPTVKRCKSQQIFREVVYTLIHYDPVIDDPTFFLGECRRDARWAKRLLEPKDESRRLTPNQIARTFKGRRGKIAAGRYVLDHGLEGCSIIAKAQFRLEKAKKLVHIYNVVTPERVFVVPVIGKLDHNARKTEIFLNTQSAVNKAFTLEQEARAMEKLKDMLTPDQFSQYILSGVIREDSKKSNTTYFVRRLKPTLAFSRVYGGGYEIVINDNVVSEDEDEQPVEREVKGFKFLAGLCLHPMAYYMSSFVGCLCPSDDVISHLLWIRGDEHGFWRKSNHHTLDHVEIGIP